MAKAPILRALALLASLAVGGTAHGAHEEFDVCASTDFDACSFDADVLNVLLLQVQLNTSRGAASPGRRLATAPLASPAVVMAHDGGASASGPLASAILPKAVIQLQADDSLSPSAAPSLRPEVNRLALLETAAAESVGLTEGMDEAAEFGFQAASPLRNRRVQNMLAGAVLFSACTRLVQAVMWKWDSRHQCWVYSVIVAFAFCSSIIWFLYLLAAFGHGVILSTESHYSAIFFYVAVFLALLVEMFHASVGSRQSWQRPETMVTT